MTSANELPYELIVMILNYFDYLADLDTFISLAKTARRYRTIMHELLYVGRKLSPEEPRVSYALDALLWAAKNGGMETLEMVLQTANELDLDAPLHGIRRRRSPQSGTTNEEEPEKMPALHWAARFGHRNVILRLLEEGANVNALAPASLALDEWVGFARTDAFLLEEILDEEKSLSWRPLYEAIRSGESETVELLLDKGASRFVSNGKDGARPDIRDLEAAAAHHQLEIIKILVRKFGQRSLNEHQSGPIRHVILQLALMGPDSRKKDSNLLECLAELIKQGADINARGVYNLTPLGLACFRGQVSAALLLLQLGSTLTMRSVTFFHGMDYLHLCALGFMKEARTSEEARAEYSELISKLIAKRANVHARLDIFPGRRPANGPPHLDEGYTPLHLAIYKEDWQLARELLKHGAKFVSKQNIPAHALPDIFKEGAIRD
ncbi:uncharacterized protein E0L32_011877 [Thyridium curvatum]|uniref:Uncharacterized protein n=1 Tax=Thyridium curvatum TaxID=1093900 RepID=A0A507BMQ8_9PEZI|nr:uncharacterized protein E0L32_011877 [Thyridium curvatum]TPX18058.1 hypothetical protein E0L32_011877 [Thyridium curvatum]